MDISKIITIFAICTIYGVDYVLSLPTFGGEFVHIKVHIPHEISGGAKHSVVHHAPKHHVKHKIIHHYHEQERPVKTLHVKEEAPLLENHYLAELDKSHNHEHSHHHEQGAKHIEETYLLKEQHHHVKPQEEENIVKVIEEYDHHHKAEPHQEYGKHHVETVKLIETAKEHHFQEDQGHHYHENHEHHYHEDHDHKYHGGLEHHVETVKFVEKKPQYHYQHQEKSINYDYHEPKEEVIKIIQAPKYGHYGHEPQVEEVVEEEQNYHDYHRPQTETVETKTTVPKGYYKKDYDAEDELLHGIIEESLDIIQTKKAKNHNYESHYQTHYGYQHPKEQETQEEYHHFDKVPATNYHYSHEPVKEHIEYEKPTSHHYSPLTHQFVKPASAADHYEEASYDNKNKYASDYKQVLPSSETPADFNASHKDYQKQNTIYEDFNTKDDFTNNVENPHAAETYTGHDSYSAGHVQGLGSGGYRYHMP